MRSIRLEITCRGNFWREYLGSIQKVISVVGRARNDTCLLYYQHLSFWKLVQWVASPWYQWTVSVSERTRTVLKSWSQPEQLCYVKWGEVASSRQPSFLRQMGAKKTHLEPKHLYRKISLHQNERQLNDQEKIFECLISGERPIFIFKTYKEFTQKNKLVKNWTKISENTSSKKTIQMAITWKKLPSLSPREWTVSSDTKSFHFDCKTGFAKQ